MSVYLSGYYSKFMLMIEVMITPYGNKGLPHQQLWEQGVNNI